VTDNGGHPWRKVLLVEVTGLNLRNRIGRELDDESLSVKQLF